MTPPDTRLWHPFADMASVRRNEFVIDRADDVWIWDEAGRRYLDGTAGLWFSNVGHGRAEIVDAIERQLRRLDAYQVFGDFAHRPALELADALTQRAPMPSRVFLTSGGGDSIDTAGKLARRFWVEQGRPERTVLLSRTDSYHGTHGYGTALAGIPANRAGFGPQVETYRAERNDSTALEALIDQVGADRVAAFFLEPVVGAGGLHPPPSGYVEAVAEVCARHDVLFVADAVICGFGRLGTWYGIERFDVVPDMIVFAKGVTSGYQPLGGLIVSDRVAEPFWSRPGGPILRHGPTYSGHPAACAAALANIELLERDDLLERGRSEEDALLDALRPLADHPAVLEVRGGTGLLAAIELKPEMLVAQPDALARVTVGAREQGVLVRPLGRGLACSPPLTASAEHFALIADALAAGLERLREPAVADEAR
jgi:putrescine---pyruvate transaminase